MPKYDVFPNPSGDGSLLDVQADLLSGLNTRVIVPLLPARLNPIFDFEDQPVVMVTQFMATVPMVFSRSQLENSMKNLRRSHPR